jgi:uncharacterized membrane protein YfcA
MHVTGVVLGFAIGFSLGLLGGGGSILTVPVFVYILGFGAKDSIAMSLVVVGTTSLVGAVGHRRKGHVSVRVASIFGGVAKGVIPEETLGKLEPFLSTMKT